MNSPRITPAQIEIVKPEWDAMLEFLYPTISTQKEKPPKFQIGQKVTWSEGQYDHYLIRYSFYDDGQKYSLTNPQGIESGGRVREDELTAID